MAAPSLVLGTAGHIDHGKSALVKALTGTDPDRLPEEKERGVTIELGFARLALPSGRVLGVVDVPGHERFIRQMVAGATGIDVVLLVVAADDGVMPQTREHLAIIDLLGIDRGVVAITKADLADPEWLAMVTDDVRELLRGTSIEGAPVVQVSAKTGQGLDELRAALDSVAAETHARQAELPFRLPVDRVFTIAGAGTVVTGTLWSGSVKRDDPVELYPSHRTARVRSVQVHSSAVEKASAGQRVALNLAGVDVDEIGRGDIAAVPGSLTVTDRFDARFTYLPGNEKPFSSGARVHVHHGTREVLGRVLLMDAEELAPGQSGYAQVRLEESLAPRYDDRFIVRSYSPMMTIGGGVVLDVLPPRRTRLKPSERETIAALAAHDVDAAAVGLLASRDMPMTSAEVAASLGVQRSVVADALNRSALERLKAGSETYFAPAAVLDELVEAIREQLLAFHAENPKATGVAALALRDRVRRGLQERVFDAVLALAVERGAAAVERGIVRHPQAAASAVAGEEAAMAALLPLLRAQGLAPVGLPELAAEAGVDAQVARRALGKLTAEGKVVRLGGELHFAREALDAAREVLVAYLREHGTLLAKDARDVLGTSRKYVVPLLEWLDAQGVTKRVGDERVLKR
ncbi:MAG TPA: selenocysteine-specific translation elongation factor [Coriobacteriia bacterium]